MADHGLAFAQLLQRLALLVALLGRSASGEVTSVNWQNFAQVQQGEWMLEFYAPWCPACQQFSGTWDSFGDTMENRVEEDRIGVGKVDVTAEPMLSGRFMVTQLPSIFHIKNGEVRQYEGDRSLRDFNVYVDDERWKSTDPIPYWKSPTAPHMFIVGTIFWLSEQARDMQVVLEEQYNMPTYAIFILIALATIVFGLLLGGVTVCVIEVCLRFCSRGDTKQEPNPAQPTQPKAPASSKPPADKSGDVRKRK